MKFHHYPGIGDVIYGLPVIKYLGGGSLYLDSTWSWVRYESVFVRSKSFLERQSYIDEVVIVYDTSSMQDDQFVDLNCFRYRDDHETDNLVKTHFLGMGLPAPKSYDPWLAVKAVSEKYPVVLHRTPRYNGLVDYSFLRRLPRGKMFCIGLPEEAKIWQDYLGATYLETPTLDDLAAVIGACGMFIGNQSSPLAIAAGLNRPRMVERSIRWRNCEFGHEHEFTLTPNGEENRKIFEGFCKKVDIGL